MKLLFQLFCPTQFSETNDAPLRFYPECWRRPCSFLGLGAEWYDAVLIHKILWVLTTIFCVLFVLSCCMNITKQLPTLFTIPLLLNQQDTPPSVHRIIPDGRIFFVILDADQPRGADSVRVALCTNPARCMVRTASTAALVLRPKCHCVWFIKLFTDSHFCLLILPGPNTEVTGDPVNFLFWQGGKEKQSTDLELSSKYWRNIHWTQTHHHASTSGMSLWINATQQWQEKL